MEIKVKCPRCGTVLQEGRFSFPICHRCKANTFRCRYCVHFDGKAGQCLHMSGDIGTITDPDQPPECGLFESRYLIREETAAARRPLTGRFWLAVGAGILVVAVAAGLLVRSMTRPREQQATLTGEFTEWPAEATVAQPARVALTLTNTSSRPAAGYAHRGRSNPC